MKRQMFTVTLKRQSSGEEVVKRIFAMDENRAGQRAIAAAKAILPVMADRKTTQPDR